jgi:K+-sensing histidine kinase KdpD
MASERGRVNGVIAVFGIAAIAVAGLLVPVRGVIDNTNVALVLVVVIVGAAALGGRLAGITTSVIAALAYNYFHTEPYYTLRVKQSEDIWTVVLLFVVGLAVGELAILGRSHRQKAQQRRAGAQRLEDIAGLLAAGRSSEELWPDIRAALMEELRLADARFEPGASHDGDSLVEVGRRGGLDVREMHWTQTGMELPRNGAQVSVRARQRTLGRIVLIPTPGQGTSPDERRVAVALADQLAVALERDRWRSSQSS